MREFVPMTDELLYDPQRVPGPLVPYRCGLPCWHQLQDAPVARDETPTVLAPARDGAVSASR